jgi:integrase
MAVSSAELSSERCVRRIRYRNQASRTREYLPLDEVERIVVAARHAGGRLAERDALLVMMTYRHGLRASELIALRWDPDRFEGGHPACRQT